MVTRKALGRERVVPPWVEAVAVDHVVALHPSHGGLLLRAERRGRGGPRVGGAASRRRLGGAGAEEEAGEAGDEGAVPVVGLVAAVVGGPRGGVPDGAVHPHRTLRERAPARVPPDRNVVHVEAATNIICISIRSVINLLRLVLLLVAATR